MLSRYSWTVFFFAFAISACSSSDGSPGGSSQLEIYEAGTPEVSYCAPVTYGGTTVTVTGQATYHARQIFDDGNGSGGLGPAPGSAFPVRYAEIQVTGGNGGLVQCSQTDGSGNFSVVLPKSTSTYTLNIYSRTSLNDPHARVSVMDRPANNRLYALSATFSAAANANIGLLDAPVTGNTLGGAFNIMDQIVKANDFLRSIAGNCSLQFTGCPDFTVAPKVSAYWMPGFDPGTYVGSGVPLSFYLPHYGRLFILGGSNGDMDHQDTDHFDDSVIIHEYGHFLEDNVFVTNSPGGAHDGDELLDPRLAWSEGWGDFIQAAVLNNPKYIDTWGNADGATGFYFNADLETPNVGNDYPTEVGEGNFREFSVTRFLWDTIDNTPNETRFGFIDDQHDRFIEIWAALNRPNHGFLDPDYGFLNVGWVHLSTDWAHTSDPLEQGHDFTNLRGLERHKPNTSDYGQLVATGGTCADFSITPAAVPGDDGSFETSDLFRNNKFYYLHTTVPISGSLVLWYKDADGVGDEADLDLFLYNELARFGHYEDWIGTSTNTPDGNPATPETETIQLNNLPPGKYLINVHVHTGGVLGGAVNYHLQLNGSTLCPVTL